MHTVNCDLIRFFRKCSVKQTGKIHVIVFRIDTDVSFCLAVIVVIFLLISEEVYIADEAFFTGTAAEITPIRDVDARIIGCGSRGPITEKIQSAYFDVVAGKNEKYIKYLTYVN
jgi:hypothetical protein